MASRGAAATVAAQIHREGPLPADKQADRSPSEAPAQGQHHKSWSGSKRASQPATPWRASSLPGPSLRARQPEAARSIICSSAPDPSITPGEAPPSRSTLAETTACSHLPGSWELRSPPGPGSLRLLGTAVWLHACVPLPVKPSQPGLLRTGSAPDIPRECVGGEGRRGAPAGRGEQHGGPEPQTQSGHLDLDGPICTMNGSPFIRTTNTCQVLS